MLKLRCYIFYFCYTSLSIWMGITGPILGLVLPYRWVSRYILSWNHMTVCLAKLLLNIRVELTGTENIPQHACVVMSKHQSQFETYYLQTIFYPLCTILKKELLTIPFFGWALAKLEPIAIDRAKPKEALRKIIRVGVERIKQNRSVLIFPEGTRVPIGETKRYAKGGADLAIAAAADILPVAHNAGYCWPSDEFLKNPGTVSVSIGPPISSAGKTSIELINEVQSWIEAESTRLAAKVIQPSN